jgi:hypothetical protein
LCKNDQIENLTDYLTELGLGVFVAPETATLIITAVNKGLRIVDIGLREGSVDSEDRFHWFNVDKGKIAKIKGKTVAIGGYRQIIAENFGGTNVRTLDVENLFYDPERRKALALEGDIILTNSEEFGETHCTVLTTRARPSRGGVYIPAGPHPPM